MKARQRRSLKQGQLAPGVACRHLPKPQSSALHPWLPLLSYLLRPMDCLLFVFRTPHDLTRPSLLLLSYLLRSLDCLLFASCAPDDLTPHYVSEPRLMMLPSREPSLAHRLRGCHEITIPNVGASSVCCPWNGGRRE